MSQAAMLTRTQSAVESIRGMIIGGDVQPGERLQAQMLADRLSVSRTPIADALAILHKEGLLEYAPNCGYGVKQFDMEGLLSAFDVRLTLEGLACRLVAEKGLLPDTARLLRDNLARTEVVLSGPAWSPIEQDEWQALNLRFHDLLIAGAGNTYLTTGVANTRVLPLIHDRAYHRIAVDEVRRRFGLPRTQIAWRDHERIFEAVAAGQGARAENMMKEHIYSNREKMRRELEFLLNRPLTGLPAV